MTGESKKLNTSDNTSPPRSALADEDLRVVVREAVWDSWGYLTEEMFAKWRDSALEGNPTRVVASSAEIRDRLGSGDWHAALQDAMRDDTEPNASFFVSEDFRDLHQEITRSLELTKRREEER